MLQLNPKLGSLINKLWERIWAGGISNPLSAIEQITYLLFMKKLDVLDLARQKHSASRFSGSFFLPGDTRKRNPINKATLRWSYFKEMKADLMLHHVQQKVFPFIKALNGDGTAFTRHMSNAVFLIASANLLKGAVTIIEDIFVEIEREAREGRQLFQDIQGDVYEMLLSEISSAGKNGQFRTPRHIIKLVTELVDPQFGQRICDPACGTAGYLLDAYQYILTQFAKEKAKKRTLLPDEDGFIRSGQSGVLTRADKKKIEKCLYGYDFDITMVRLALMNLMMHGIDDPHVDYQDTLSKGFSAEGIYDVVMANPPFTGSIDRGDVSDILQFNTTKTELLFIERIFHLLKIGGTAGVIVPQGVLFGGGTAYVEARKKLVEEAELKAVISLPSGVFKPYAGVATAILIFTRGGKTRRTWLYDVQNDGLSLDDRRKRVPGTELPDVLARWLSRQKHKQTDRTKQFFFVSLKELRMQKYDLSYSTYHDSVRDPLTFEEPAAILKNLRTLEEDIREKLAELADLLR